MFTVLFAILLLLAILAPYINPSIMALPNIVAIVTPWIVAGNIVCAVFWLFTRHKKIAILPAAMLLLSMPAILRIFPIHHPKPSTHPTLSILTYNTQRLHDVQKNNNPILEFIRQTDADIVCLQEIETNKNDNSLLSLTDLKHELRQYPYSYIDFKIYKNKRQYGLAVFSKYPLQNKHTLHYESIANESDCCDVIVGNDTIRLFNNHLQSNRLTPDNIPENLSAEELRKKTSNIYRKLKTAYSLRSQQADTIAAYIDTSPYPVIVVGDFNDTPQSYTYRKLSKNLHDAYMQTHLFNRGNTYQNKGINVRIDYVLCSKCITPIRSEVIKIPHSDHYPLLCKLQISDK